MRAFVYAPAAVRSNSSPVSGVTMPVKVNCASVFRAKPYRSVACVCRKHTSVESAYSAFHNTVDNSIILISFEQQSDGLAQLAGIDQRLRVRVLWRMTSSTAFQFDCRADTPASGPRLQCGLSQWLERPFSHLRAHRVLRRQARPMQRFVDLFHMAIQRRRRALFKIPVDTLLRRSHPWHKEGPRRNVARG